MSTLTDVLETRYTANILNFEKEIKRMQSLNKRTADRIKTDHEAAASGVNRAWQKADISKAMNQQVGAVRNLKSELISLAPALATAFSVHEAIAAADTYTRFTNQLKIAGLAGEELAAIQLKLFATAKNAGIGVEALGTLYARTAASGKDLGANQAQLLAVTDAVALSLKVSGASAESAQGALLQLGQALGAPKIQAQEYNSLLDGMPALLKAMAIASTEYGGSVAKMTADVKGGNVTNREFFDLIIKALPTLQGQAAQATTTFGQAMQTLQTSLVQYIGEADASLHITERLAQAIVAVAGNLDALIGVITIVGGVLATRMVAGLATAAGTAALTAVQMTLLGAGITGMSASATAGAVAMSGLRVAMGFLGGPIGIAILAISAAVAGLAYASGDADRAAKKLTAEFDRQNPAASKLVEATNKLALAQGAQRKEALEAAKAARTQAAAELKNAQAKLQSAKASLALMQAEHLRTVNKGIDPEGGYGAMVSMGAAEKRKQKEVNAWQADINVRTKQIKDAEAAIAAASKPVAVSTGTGDTKTKAAKATGPSAAELTQRRDALKLENELLIARARGDEKQIADLEDKQALLRMIEQFEQTGLKTAEARAKAEEVMLGVTYARLQQLKENPTITAAKGPDLNPDGVVLTSDSMAKIGDDLAAHQQELRDGFASALRGGLDAAIQGGWPGLVEYMGNSLRQKFMDSLIDVIANAVFPKGGMGGGGGGGIFGTVLSFGAKLFGGHASGTNFSSGGLKLVGEKGPELVGMPMGSQVLPNNLLKNAFTTPPGSTASGGTTVHVHNTINANNSLVLKELQQQIAQSSQYSIQAARQLTKADIGRSNQNNLIHR